MRTGGVLAHREFRALWGAEAQSIAGDQLAKVALTVTVYRDTGSALWSAAAYALTFLPALLGGLGLAQLADRYPRRTVMVVATAVQAVLIAAMAWPEMPVWSLAVLYAGAGVAQAPALAAQNAMTRQVLTDDHAYFASQDLRGVTNNTMMLLGLAGGGVLVGYLGGGVALLADAGTFALAALLVRAGVQHRPAAAPDRAGWCDGLRYVAATPWLRTLLGLSWLVGFVVVPEGLAPALAAELDAPSGAVGWLLAADPLGYILGLFLFARLLDLEARQRWIAPLAGLSPAILLAFAISPPLWLALLLLAAAGAVGAYQVTVAATMTSQVPNEVRGGVLGVARTGLRVAQGVGVAAGGALAELLGSAPGAIAIAGLAGALLAVPLGLAWTRLHRGTPRVEALHG